MLNLLRAWLINRRRAIFRFWDGRRVRAVDPIEVSRLLRRDPFFDAETHLKLIDAGDDEAIRVTANAVRQAFGIPDLQGGGLAELECLAVLMDFYEFLHALKKNTSPTPSEQPPTESLSSDASTMPPRSDSGSTSTGSRCDEPALSSSP